MLKALGDAIWQVDGPELVFAGAPMHTRMIVVRLSGGGLWVHSPIAFSAEVHELVTELGGPVVALVAPNKFHHLYVQEWVAAHPDAQVFAEARAQAKVAHLRSATTLTDQAPDAYCADIDQVLFNGNRMFAEAVFFHKASHTLILTDLMINLRVDRAPFLPRMFLRFEGVTFPDGGIPRLYRWLSTDRAQLRGALEKVNAWAPQQLTFCHGDGFATSAQEVLQREFAWLAN
ncbi:MAG: DUF4336 domain-containing protein [Pseudomonadota bacterium]